ncbi:MAG: 4Fe-4S dicluster domain-containing protein [Actinobacteria bacterium]|nr:4Fe-4S dicluster domain-containing protein [Actinomycetota bacterium]
MDFAAKYDLPSSLITRESFFNIGGPHGFMRWGIYIFFAITLVYLIYTLQKQIKVWRKGKEELRTDSIFKRVWMVIKYAGLQVKILKEAYAGIMHASIFFAFLGLILVTALIMIQDDFTELFFNIRYLEGNFYLLWSLFADICGAVLFIGLCIAIYRRYITKPSRLDTKKTDTFILLILLVIVLTGFITEALRIAITGFPAFEVWSPFGYALAYAFTWINNSALSVIHAISWWIHMVLSFIFIALWATEKTGHILISTLNIFFANLENENPKTKYAMSVIPPEEFETSESFGVSFAEEFTWKQLMDGDACTRCGRCQDNCPAFLTEKPLSPKKIINDIKDNKDERIPKILEAQAKAEDPSNMDLTTIDTKALVGASVLEDEIWACTNCGACMEACPVQIEHVNAINSMRRSQVLMEGKMAPELQTAFTNMENNSNPYGFAFASRAEWIPEDLELKSVAEDPDIDYLYFVGCAASFDKRNQKVAIALVKILQKAGYKIGILGSEEACCGDSAMRAGNEYLFQMLSTQNMEIFKNYGIKKIITTCPHGYNVLKKEYPKLAAKSIDSNGNPLECNYQVYHHSEVIFDLLRKGQIKITDALNEKITYHDSCMLGRYNNIYTQPRDLIKAIPGTNLVEMSRHHKKSFCCGAGGSRMWLEEDIGTRINQFRTKEAQSTGAVKICTACPFCMTMLSDGVQELDIKNLETYDIAELVYNAMAK